MPSQRKGKAFKQLRSKRAIASERVSTSGCYLMAKINPESNNTNGVIEAINTVSTKLVAINETIGKILEKKEAKPDAQKIDIPSLINTVDHLFDTEPKNYKKQNIWEKLLGSSLVFLLIAVLLAMFVNIRDTLNAISLGLSAFASIFALLSFYLQAKDTKSPIQDVIANKAIARYSSALTDASITNRTVGEKIIIKALIMLRSKNENFPLIEVYKKNPAMFKEDKLLEILYA